MVERSTGWEEPAVAEGDFARVGQIVEKAQGRQELASVPLE